MTGPRDKWGREGIVSLPHSEAWEGKHASDICAHDAMLAERRTRLQVMLPMHDGVADLMVEWGECLAGS